ncbi:ATP-binding cassette domain-containing protein [Herbiconiux moechotypicola]|nr:ATP-binding cassette domain-containing protein [Herbiconiux moechotypicola]MCS5729793.1 ATP-binding cassette domain-containing protein [Herbiconiux moechotypicola]
MPGLPATPALGLTAEGWGWRHAGRASWAQRGLDLAIEPGERVLLLGASGAGKSTLLHAFAGVLGGADEGEEEGSLRVGDADPREVRGRTGLVLQDPEAQVVLDRLGDDIAFGCENLGVPPHEIWPRVTAALAAVGLDLPLDRPTTQLSGGQKQRLALAGALAMRPGVLLLDEPTANLDPAGVLEVTDAVGRVVRDTGATLVVIEHRVATWLDQIDRVIVLGAGGGLLADGPAEQVLREHGDRLAAEGVWVPGIDPLHGRRPVRTASAPGGETLLTAHDLVVARDENARRSLIGDLELTEGEALAVTGANGAGKSTLALTLAGLLPVASGRIEATDALRHDATAAGRPAPADPAAWTSRQVLTRVGVVFQDPEHQFVAGTVRAELEAGLRALGLPAAERDARVADAASRLRLEPLLDVNPYTLSGGEKRRLSVASALVARPRVLVLDEPTFGQDSRTWAELVLLLGELLDRGTAVVAVTHDRAFLDAVADRELTVAPQQSEAPAADPAHPETPRGRRLNPVAALVASLVVSALLIVTIDPVSAGVALALEAIAAAGILASSAPAREVAPALARRTLAIWIAAPLAGVTTLLYGAPSGTTYWQFGLLHVSDGSIGLAVATTLRILAIGLPAVVLFARTDPTDLADGLAQLWRLPSRFVLGALAGLRLIGLFTDDWRQLALARRARGLADTGRVRRVAGQVFALLVLSIRRGSTLATAMEARGFGGGTPRTWARRSEFGMREWLLIAGGALIGGIALAVSVATGAIRLVVG